MIDFSEKTYEKIQQDMMDRIEIDVNRRETGILKTSISPAAFEFANIYEQLTLIQNNAFVLTANGIYLDYLCVVRGLLRKKATAATRLIKFNTQVAKGNRFSTVNGDNSLIYITTDNAEVVKKYDFEEKTYKNVTIKTGTGIEHLTTTNKWYKDNVEITVTSDTTLPIPSISTLNKYYYNTTTSKLVFGVELVDYYKSNATCEVVGTIGNDYVGDVLPLVNIQGLTSAIITDVILEGTDDETDVSLRTRYINSLESKSFAGNISSYREQCLLQSGVGAVQVYPHFNGGGTVKCVILNSNLGVATSALIDSVQAAICPPETGTSTPSPLGYGIAPIGARCTISTATNFSINLSFKVSLESGVTIASIQPLVEQVFEEYLESVRQSWGNALITHEISYPVNLYIARLSAKLLEITGILNVTEMKFNGANADISCTETASLQQLPVKGTVTISE